MSGSGTPQSARIWRSGSWEERGPLLAAPPPMLWALILAIAAVGGSWALACVTPFAAFAVLAAATLDGGTAVLAIGLIWVANQAVGYALLHYPLTRETALWGSAIGVAALVATLGAALLLDRLRLGRVVGVLAGFVLAFALYEGVLYATSQWLGDSANFSPAIIRQIAMQNAEWLAALAVIVAAGRAIVGRIRGGATTRAAA